MSITASTKDRPILTFDHSAAELPAVFADIERLGLQQHVYELEAYGLTIVPPDRVGSPQLISRALEKILDLIEKRSGTRPDLLTGETHKNQFLSGLSFFMLEDEAFIELLLDEVALTLVTYLLGEQCHVYSSEAFVKGPAEPGSVRDDGLQLWLHSDLEMVPPPFPFYAQVCNATWLLTDYTKESGSLAFLPGSHRFCRQPIGSEGARRAVPIEAPRGSFVLWHGNTWHGSFPRTIPGLRVGMSYALARMYHRELNPYKDTVAKELLDRYPPRFATLMGQHLYTWGEEGPDMSKLSSTLVRSLYA